MKPTKYVNFIADNSLNVGTTIYGSLYKPAPITNAQAASTVLSIIHTLDFIEKGVLEYELIYNWGILEFTLSEEDALFGIFDGSLEWQNSDLNSSNYPSISWKLIDRGALIDDAIRIIESDFFTSKMIEKLENDYYRKEWDAVHNTSLQYIMDKYNGSIVHSEFQFTGVLGITRL